MRLYSFKKNVPIQRLASHKMTVLNRYSVLMATMVAGAICLNTMVYADDQLDAVPADNTLEAFTQSKSAAKSDIELVSRPLIAGLWGMRIPKVTCIEYYNFKENGQFVVKSAEEWSLGKYVYQLPDMESMSKTLPQLTMGILYDSNAVDCSGNNINQTGEVQQEFVKWINPSHIQFCATADGKQCPLDLYRVLP